MVRNSLLAVSLLALALIAAFTIACGSSKNTFTQPCTGTYNVVGNWQITVTDTGGATVTGYGAIDSTGLALFFDTNPANGGTGDTVELPTLTGACSYSGTVTAYAEPGSVNSGTVVTDSITGNVNSTSSITGSFSGASTGTIALTPFTPLSGTISAITGTKTGEVEGSFATGPFLSTITLIQGGTGASMSFSGTDGQTCNVNGTFTQQSTANVFDASITFAGQSCPITGTFSGLGFESSTDYFFGNTGGTYLYADILDSTNTFVMEIF